MLKKLFYASASILMLLLVATYLRPGRAAAQFGGETIVGVGIGTPFRADGTLVLTSSGNLYAGPNGAGSPTLNGWVLLGNVAAMAGHPGEASPFTALFAGNGGFTRAATANGDVFIMYGDTPGWQYWGNVFGSPTPAARQTFGQLKAQYRK